MAERDERGGRGRRGRDDRGGRHDRQGDAPELADRLVAINRVSKTVKGGKRFGFAALVVVGDQKGRVGFGSGKAKEVPEAIRKATEEAKRTMIRVPLREGRTLHHDMPGRWGAGKVVMRAAPAGTGIIAGGPMRAVFEMLGVQDVVAKSTGQPEPLQHGSRDVRRAEVRELAPHGGAAAAARRSRTSCRRATGGAGRARPKRPPKRPPSRGGRHGQDHRRQADRQPDPPS